MDEKKCQSCGSSRISTLRMTWLNGTKDRSHTSVGWKSFRLSSTKFQSKLASFSEPPIPKSVGSAYFWGFITGLIIGGFVFYLSLNIQGIFNIFSYEMDVQKESFIKIIGLLFMLLYPFLRSWRKGRKTKKSNIAKLQDYENTWICQKCGTTFY